MSDTPTMTAVRTWNRTHTTAKVTVTVGNETQRTLGGRRAHQCKFAIANQWHSGSYSVTGLRSEPRGEGERWWAVPIVEGA